MAVFMVQRVAGILRRDRSLPPRMLEKAWQRWPQQLNRTPAGKAPFQAHQAQQIPRGRPSSQVSAPTSACVIYLWLERGRRDAWAVAENVPGRVTYVTWGRGPGCRARELGTGFAGCAEQGQPWARKTAMFQGLVQCRVSFLQRCWQEPLRGMPTTPPPALSVL